MSRHRKVTTDSIRQREHMAYRSLMFTNCCSWTWRKRDHYYRHHDSRTHNLPSAACPGLPRYHRFVFVWTQRNATTLLVNANQVKRHIEGPDKNKHWLTFSARFSPHATLQKDRSTVIMNDVPLCTTTLRERTAAGTREGFQSLSWSGIGLFVPARTGTSARQQQRTLPYAK